MSSDLLARASISLVLLDMNKNANKSSVGRLAYCLFSCFFEHKIKNLFNNAIYKKIGKVFCARFHMKLMSFLYVCVVEIKYKFSFVEAVVNLHSVSTKLN